MHKKRVADSPAANQSENEKRGMDLAVVRLLQPSRSNGFTNRAKFKHLKDDESDVDGEAGTGKENADDSPTKQIALVGQSGRRASDRLRGSRGQDWTRGDFDDRFFGGRLRKARELNPIGNSLLPHERIIG